MANRAGQTQYLEKMNNFNSLVDIRGVEGAGGISMETLASIFGSLWLPEGANYNGNLQYLQSTDLNLLYKNRSVPLFGSFISANIRNAENDWLLSVVSPIYETDEQHFSVMHKEWNAVPLDEIQEGGLGAESSYTKWGWTDTTQRFRGEEKFSVDLAHDKNFGAMTFMENVAALGNRAMLTIYRNISYRLVTIGYQNMVQDRTLDISFDVTRLFQAEASAFHVFALDAAMGVQMIHDKRREIPGLDMVILPENGTRFFYNYLGRSTRTLQSKRVQYDEFSKQLVAVPRPGPTTYLSEQLGDGFIDYMELTSFTVNSHDKRPENPLSAKLTLCQFFPPNPNIRAETPVTSTNPDLLDVWIYYQTKESGEERKITFKDCLKHCWLWDAEGKPSEAAKTFIQRQNGHVPWQFKEHSSDINNDKGDYNEPSVDALCDMQDKDDVRHMMSIREEPVFDGYSPELDEHYWPEAVGDYNLSALPNAWILRAVKSLALKFHEETGIHTARGFNDLFSLLDNIKRAPVTKEYIAALIDAQVPAVLATKVGDDDPIQPNFLIDGVASYAVNKNGSLKIPKDASLMGMRYTNGFHSGPGLLTIRDELLGQGSIFTEQAQEAEKALRFVDMLITFIKKYIGKSDVISPDFAPKWFGLFDEKKKREAEIATFIDAIYPNDGPVFLGVPTKGNNKRPDTENSPSFVGIITGKTGKSLYRIINEATSINETWENHYSLSESFVVDDAILAFACLSPAVALDYKTLILKASTFEKEETNDTYDQFYEVSQSLFKYIIEFGRKYSQATQKMINAVTQKFYSILAPNKLYASVTFTKTFIDGKEVLGGTVEEAKNFIKSVTSKANKNLLDDIKKQTYFGTETIGFIEQLEQKLREVVDTKIKNRPAIIKKKTGTKLADDEYMESDGFKAEKYEGVPKKYLRSALLSSDALIEFIQESNFVWALPADKNADYRVPNYDVVNWKRAGGPGDKTGFYASHFDLLSGRHGLSGNFSEINDEALFGFGEPIQDRYNQFSYTEKSSKKARSAAASTASEKEYIFTKKYKGPWKNRLDFMEALDDAFERVAFNALIQTPNERQVHEKLATIGAQLINVVLFRPFIQCFASSVIVMRAGEDTVATPISRIDTTISKEDRGYFHIGCSFYHGIVRMKPDNIQLIPYSIPERFVSGKKCDFITSRTQWSSVDMLKPSIIALPTAIAERTYRPIVHMMNAKAVARPDIDHAIWEGKYSAARFYCHIYGEDNCLNIEAFHCERMGYGDGVPISHVAYLGPRAFIDQHTLQRVDHNGVGPGNDRRMNQDGAHLVWNGLGNTYPDLLQTIKTRARAQ